MKYQIIKPTDYTPEVIVSMSPEGVFLFIPTDLENLDYKAYLHWLSEGNTPELFEGQG
jgi:hypothetical protein